MNNVARKRGAMAMLLVVVIMAAAAVMGFALLSSASTQSQASKNSTSAVCAEGLTQTGANLALYYLMNPDKADTARLANPNSGSITFYNPGANVPALNLATGSTVSSIDVSLISKGNYNVDVTATSSANGASITRKVRTVVQAPTRYVPKYAMAHNGAFTMPLTFVTSSINGPVRCDSGYGGLLTAVTGLLFGTTGNALPTYPQHACPTYSQLNICKYLVSNNGKYLYNGGLNTGTATYVGTSNASAANLTGASAFTNPGSVYYFTGDTSLSGTINFNGTVIVANGKSLTISSNAITITAKPGYPALIVNKDIIFNGLGKALTVNGVCYIGGNLTGTGTLPSGNLTVNGSLMWGGTNSQIDTTKLTATSKLTVNWPSSASTLDSPTPDIIYVPDLSDYDQMTKSVKVVSTAVLAH